MLNEDQARRQYETHDRAHLELARAELQAKRKAHLEHLRRIQTPGSQRIVREQDDADKFEKTLTITSATDDRICLVATESTEVVARGDTFVIEVTDRYGERQVSPRVRHCRGERVRELDQYAHGRHYRAVMRLAEPEINRRLGHLVVPVSALLVRETETRAASKE